MNEETEPPLRGGSLSLLGLRRGRDSGGREAKGKLRLQIWEGEDGVGGGGKGGAAREQGLSLTGGKFQNLSF